MAEEAITISAPKANSESTATPTDVSPFGLNCAAVKVLVLRDLRRFFRQRSRVVGALVQPLIFWLVIGAGMGQSFRIAGAEGVGYIQYFYPGIVMLVVLFTSIFTTMSVIEDRHKGFLQAVLVAPSSRSALVLGKTLGGVAIALAQAAIFLALAPWAGFSWRTIDWALLWSMLLATSIGLSSLGFAIAWWLDSTQGYHVVMSVLLIPLWILSGAMFPVQGASNLIGWIMRLNPMTYCVAGLRRALYGGYEGTLGPSVGVKGSTLNSELIVMMLFAAVALAWAIWICGLRRKKA